MVRRSHALALLIPIWLTAPLVAQTGLISTIAGTGWPGTAGVGGPAAAAQLVSPGPVAQDAAGNLFIVDGNGANRVVRIDAAMGTLTLVAGNGTAASTGDGGPAAQASLNRPTDVAVDAWGDLFIAEFNGNRIRRVDGITGIITTVAGTGTAGFSGDGGPATSANLTAPMGVAVDTSGNLFIADAGNYRIRRVDANTRNISTIAGNGTNAVTPDGQVAAGASIALPMTVSLDIAGNVVFGEYGSKSIRRISNYMGVLSTLAGNGSATYTGDGVGSAAAGIGLPGGKVYSDSVGNMFFSDATGRIRRIDGATGIISTVAGNGSGFQNTMSAGGSGGGGGPYPCGLTVEDNVPATTTTINGPVGVVLAPNGNLIFADWIDCRVRNVALPAPNPYTNVAITASATNIAEGQSVTFTATVSPIGATGTPSGTITFADTILGGINVLGSVPMVFGTASLTVSTLLANGGHTIAAFYSGDGSFNGAGSPGIPITVLGGSLTWATVNLSFPSTATANMATPFTATVTPPAGNSNQPTGSVQLYDGLHLVGTAPLNAGVAQFAASFARPGTHGMTAVYLGDSNYPQVSSATTSLGVKAQGSVSLVSNNNPATYGATVTFTASVTPVSATGTVQFSDGTQIYATVPVVSGNATFTTSSLAAGAHAMVAYYNGDLLVNGNASPVLTETVGTAPAIVLSSSATSSTYGQSVQFTASITPASSTGTVQFLDGTTVLGAAAIAGGTAIFTTPSLNAGNHTITAVFNSATSPAVIETVAQVTPTVVLTGSGSPSAQGQAVTFTATVTPISTGATVQFFDGSTLLGSGTLSTGPVTFSTSTLSAGAHSITAVVNGDTNLLSATSAALIQTVQASTTVTVSAPGGPFTYGQAVPLTATVSPAAATGMVQFSDGATALGTVTLSGGTATLSVSSFAPGTHPITAAYSGDTTYLASSGTLSLAIGQVSSAVALTSTPNPANSGQAVTFTATVTPSTATGTVQFFDYHNTLLGTATISGGVATLTTSTIPIGPHSIDALYSGDSNSAGSRSTAITQTILIPTTTVLYSNFNPATVGATIGITATVQTSGATGTITLVDVTVPSSPVSLGTGTVVNGTASFSITLPAGTHNLQANYSGDSSFQSSSSAILAQVVSKVTTTTGLTANPPLATVGQAVQFTATVTPAAATGTVQFSDGATALGTVALNNGTAVLSISSLAAGQHSITAVYSGDSTYATSTSPAFPLGVRVTTTTVITSSVNPSTAGQAVTFTATVSPNTATGQVIFLEGSTTLATVNVTNGVAAFTISSLAIGSHNIQASYMGDSNDVGSSVTVSQTVTKVNSTVVLTSSLNPATVGQAVTFTATVSPNTATGTVQFLDGATSLGVVTLSSGTAALSIATLSAGSHSITAVYSGDTNTAVSTSAVLGQTVSKLNSTVTVGSSLNPSSVGQAVTFSAAVSPSSATGTVQFLDGAISLGVVTLSGGAAALSTAALGAGMHSITAVYSGDANTAASTSAVLAQTVLKLNSTVAVGSSLNPSSVGQTVTFTAAVTPNSATGTVQFLDGAASLGVVPLSGGAAALSTAALGAGTHSITAVYSGDANTSASSSGALAQSVLKLNSAVSLASSPNPSTDGQSVTFSATVSPASATGTVQFRDGASVLATVAVSGGSAVWSTYLLAVGSHSMTAVYSGDSVYNASSSGALTQTVNRPPAPTLTAPLSPNQGNLGESVTVTFTGTNFIPGATSVNVLSGSGVTISNINVVSSTQMTAIFTVSVSATLGSRGVTVTTPGGTSGSRNFLVYGLPMITSISPTSGLPSTNVSVRLRGTNFSRDSMVHFSGSGVTATIQSITNDGQTINVTFAISSSAPIGPQSVTVTNSVGTSNAVTFTVQ